MSTIVENILNPKQVLDANKESLMRLYQEDYGEEEVLRKRWDNTVFILESNPMETKEFIEEHKGLIKLTTYLRTKREYSDYVKKQKQIEEDMKREFQLFLENYFCIYNKEDIDRLWNTSRLQEASYVSSTSKLGEKSVLQRIDHMKKEIHRYGNQNLLLRTIWGRRILSECRGISVEQVAEVLMDETTSASTSAVRTVSGDIKTLCFIPLIRQVKSPSLDRIVLHELRHVVETRKDRTGLYHFDTKQNELLNEIRTEKNAMKDEKRMPILFSRNSNQMQSLYEFLLKRIGDIEPYEAFFNKIAVSSNPDELEEQIQEDIQGMNQRILEEQMKIKEKCGH